MQVIRFGIDLAKNVFQVHGVDASGQVVVQRQLRRAQVEKFFAAQPPALIGMEACGSAHHWARTLSALGHEVKLMPPAYVKPYVPRNKNDVRDAHGCCEAVSRPDMRFVPVKTVEQQWARGLHRTRDLLVRQRTQLANAMRSLLYEMGQTSAQGAAGMEALLRRIEASHEAIPAALLICLTPLAGQWRALDAEIGKLDKQIVTQVKQDRAAIKQIVTQVKQDRAAMRLTKIPSVGPIIAQATIAAIGDGRQFASGRDFAAWLGLTRKSHDTGGKHKLTGHISRAGDRDLRRLLILGASSWLRQVRAKPDRGSPWIRGLLARRPVKVAVVAQAAKTARIIWAMLASGQEYRQAQYRAPVAA